jgi:hypothetical protein
MVWAQGAALKPSVNDDAAAKPPGEKANPRTAKASPEGSSRTSSATQSIVALVNDEPITGYEVEERMRLALLAAPS